MIKKGLFYVMVAFFVCLAACGQIPDNVTPTATPAPTVEPTAVPTEVPEVTPAPGDLTEEEIKFFNEQFFTTETEYPGRWVRNNILYTEFSNPAQVDIEAMLYDENSSEEISKEERDYIREQLEERLDTSKVYNGIYQRIDADLSWNFFRGKREKRA